MNLKNQNVATRLISILLYLNKGEVVNVKALSLEFAISERQIQDDIKLFKTFFEIENLKHGDYRLKQAFEFTKVDTEVQNITLALLQALQQSALPQMNHLVAPLMPDVKAFKNIFYFQFEYEKINNFPLFYELIDAIKQTKSCSFVYSKKDGSSREVYVNPYLIANFSNSWYLLAYDVEVKILKSYLINAISHFTLSTENYISNAKVEKEIELFCAKADSPWYSGILQTVVLEVKDEAKHYLHRNTPHNLELLESTTEYDRYKFSFYDDDRELFVFMKQWIPDIKIIDNKKLKNSFLSILHKYLSNF